MKLFGRGLAFLVALSALGQPIGADVLFDLGMGARGWALAGAGVAFEADPLFLNPAGLAWTEELEILSAYGNQFGAAQLLLLSGGGPGWALGAMALDAGEIVPGLRYRVEGVSGAAAFRVWDLALGVRARVLRPVAPREGLGWALDGGLLWRGPIHVGLVGKGLLSRPAFPGEEWLGDLLLGLALPFGSPPFHGTLGLAAGGFLQGRPEFAIGGEAWVEGLALRAGLGSGGLGFGGSARWALFQLDWALSLHPVLPPAFRVSLAVRL